MRAVEATSCLTSTLMCMATTVSLLPQVTSRWDTLSMQTPCWASLQSRGYITCSSDGREANGRCLHRLNAHQPILPRIRGRSAVEDMLWMNHR